MDALHQLQDEVRRLHTLLTTLDPPAAVWLEGVLALAERQPEQFLRELNSAQLWGGAGSIANQPLQPSSDLDPWQWQQDIRLFREQMIRVGEILRRGDSAHPDIDTWLLAFHNWNAAQA